MQPSTIEKALHKWSPWQESIAKARSSFSFVPLPSGQKLKEWQSKHNDDVFALGEEELGHLGLPQSALNYWLACFFSDYLKSDGSIDYDNIREVFFSPHGEFGKKEYPLLFYCQGSLAASTRKELLRLKIRPLPDEISPLPRDLEKIISSIRGRKPQYGDILEQIRRNELDYEGMLRAIGESGDIQAAWSSIKHNCKTNTSSLKKERRKLISRINGIGSRLWRRAPLSPPGNSERGAWCRDFFPI